MRFTTETNETLRHAEISALASQTKPKSKTKQQLNTEFVKYNSASTMCKATTGLERFYKQEFATLFHLKNRLEYTHTLVLCGSKVDHLRKESGRAGSITPETGWEQDIHPHEP